MKNFLLFLLLGLTAFSCGSDQPAATETASEEIAPEVSNEERVSQIAPSPPVCVFLTEAEVLSFFEPGVKIPIAGSRATTTFNSCQYNLQGPNWSGTLVLEMPEKVNDVQSIRDEVSGAKGQDAVQIGGSPSRIMNGGRIISVEADRPFRVKFSALPTPGNAEIFDEAQRRDLIVRLAEAAKAS